MLNYLFLFKVDCNNYFILIVLFSFILRVQTGFFFGLAATGESSGAPALTQDTAPKITQSNLLSCENCLNSKVSDKINNL